jgi:RimJ/RimL family protein N-acetyltransferase
MDNYLFKSKRLGFRKWGNDDLDPLSEMNNDPEVMKYFPSQQDRATSAAFMDRQTKNFDKSGYCFFAVDAVSTRQFIGFIGIQNIPYSTPFTPAIEIGWRLIKSSWSNGYATEGAQICLQYAFEHFDINQITAMTALLNSSSEKVMKKIGMRKAGEFDHPKIPDSSPLKRHIWYSKITKHDKSHHHHGHSNRAKEQDRRCLLTNRQSNRSNPAIRYQTPNHTIRNGDGRKV